MYCIHFTNNQFTCNFAIDTNHSVTPLLELNFINCPYLSKNFRLLITCNILINILQRIKTKVAKFKKQEKTNKLMTQLFQLKLTSVQNTSNRYTDFTLL